jgi:hypothetical protein
MNNPSSNPNPSSNANPNTTSGPAQVFQQDERLAYSMKVGELVSKGLRGGELEAEMRRWMMERKQIRGRL